MQIHELQTTGKPSRKRIGRGGVRGTYSGRGMKGQKARSGGNVNPLFEGGRSSLVQRMKKARGFKSPHPKAITLTLTQLEGLFDKGDTVSRATLKEKKILRNKTRSYPVRVIATGELKKALTIAADVRATAAATEAISKAGGVVETEQKAATKKAAQDKK